MKIFNYSESATKGGRNGARPGRNRDASGKIFKSDDGHIRLYATVANAGEFEKLERVLFAEEDGVYYFIADKRGSKTQKLHQDQKKKQSKSMLRLICDAFPHKGGEQWFLGDFTDETKTRIRLTFDA